MSLQLATKKKEAITHNTGLLARVRIKNGEYAAAPVLPGAASQLSSIQRSALYVVYAKASANDRAITIGTALQSGVFDSRYQCVAIYDTLRSFGWLKELEGRYSLTAKGQEFIQNYMNSKGKQTEQGSNFIKRHIGETI